jgi:sialate O-acetylesterase
MNKLRLVCGIVLLTGGLAAEARADVSLAKVFSDNMMLQRDKAIRVWGSAAPGEEVKAALVGKSATAESATAKGDDKGRWSVELPALKEGENLELTVTGKNTITLTNMIMGDIWVCSGQSNMTMNLGGDLGRCFNAPEDVKKADLPKIRYFHVGPSLSVDPQEDFPINLTPSWQVCSPKTANSFSAAAFYFAREVFQKTGVPIGLMVAEWSGSNIEPWTPQEGLEAVPELKEAFDRRRKTVAAYRTVQLPKYLEELDRWTAATRKVLAQGKLPVPPPQIPQMPCDVPGISPESGNWCCWNCMYNVMVNPLIRCPIKGALWYQGESNSNGDEEVSYYHKMRALVGGWRKVWGQGDFPFYYVQLATYGGVPDDPAHSDNWVKVCCAQTRAMAIPNTGMASACDIGEESCIHPGDKMDVGLRLARWALNRDYGQKDLVPSGPIFKEMKIDGDKVRLSFDYIGSGLMVGKKDGTTLEAALAPTIEDKGAKLKRFAIAGEDKKWHWADAVIDGNTVVVSSPDVKKPAAVRYAFSSNPGGANLYNREGLPASPFRTDNW